MGKRRVLVFIVAYNAERTLEGVIRRIPASLAAHDTHILVIDDSSRDRTFERARALEDAPFPMTALCNPINQGYGGNQKIGFHYALKEKFDAVALVHGDGQYAPECLPDLFAPVLAGAADAVFGSRMMVAGGALHDLYRATWGFESPQTLGLERIPAGAKVLAVGSASGYMARALRGKGCQVTGLDTSPPPPERGLNAFIRADLNDGFPIAAG